jgi:hypothetical protein
MKVALKVMRGHKTTNEIGAEFCQLKLLAGWEKTTRTVFTAFSESNTFSIE